MVIFASYLDDQLIAGINDSELQLFKAELCKRFKIKNIGEADEFLYKLLITVQSAHHIFHNPSTSIKFLSDMEWVARNTVLFQ